jgi:predicted DNA-binding ribbon-helix-helix protein
MKKLPKTKKLMRQSFTCTDAEWKSIQEYARARDVSVSKLIRSIILDAIKG